jgi:hypothetical protein
LVAVCLFSSDTSNKERAESCGEGTDEGGVDFGDEGVEDVSLMFLIR